MILGVDSYVLNVEQNHFNKVYRANTRTNKIRNSNIEIRNKLYKSQIGKIQNTESEGSLFRILPILVI